MFALLASTMVLAVVVASCSGAGDDRASSTTSTSAIGAKEVEAALATDGSTVPATLAVPQGFVPVDARGVAVPPVLPKHPHGPNEDHTKPILPVTGGTSVIHGTVWGPDGPVDGATVRLERFVGEDWGFLDVGTNKDGRYNADGLLGGRYRIRAWQKPDMATTESQAVFLKAGDGNAGVDVGVERFEGTNLQGALTTAEPQVGQQVTFQALLTKDDVDDDGIVRGAGIGQAFVQLTALDGLKVIGQDLQITGEDGFANFIIQCTSTGLHSVIISSGDKALALGLPECLPGTYNPDDAFPTGPDKPDPSTPKGSTTTTAPKTTTTTTKKPSTTTTTRAGGH